MTALYNGVPLGIVFRLSLSPTEIPWPLVPLVLWWTTAIVLALVAAVLDVRAGFRDAPVRHVQ